MPTTVRNALICVAGIVKPYTCAATALGLLAAVALAQSTASSAQPVAAPAEASSEMGALCLREGTRLVDESGQFQLNGQRMVFVASEGNRRFILLENLNLERIARVLGEGDKQSVWRVSGSVTEYHGANYLLVERAVLFSSTHTAGTAQAARTPPPSR